MRSTPAAEPPDSQTDSRPIGDVMASSAGHDTPPPAEPEQAGELDSHGGTRRRAAYLYGLIICGAVLAADPENIAVWLVGVSLLATVLVYWIAESFAHWVAARATHPRGLTGAERWATVTDGFPLVLAGCVPALVVFIEAIAGVAEPAAIQIALLVNVALLAVLGWIMSPSERPLSPRRFAYAAITALLGAAMIGLKSLLHR